MERAQEITAFCQERGWKVIAGIEEDEPEDLRDLQRLMNPNESLLDGSPPLARPELPGMQPIRKTRIGRNEPCPCDSGLSYKKCCGKSES
jgi:preprotein translocase subunit SecA